MAAAAKEESGAEVSGGLKNILKANLEDVQALGCHCPECWKEWGSAIFIAK
jgi:hypothetical protein